MTQESPQSAADKLIAVLSDADRLRERGVSEEWLRDCAELVDQYRRLRTRCDELERVIASSGPHSPDDTIVS